MPQLTIKGKLNSPCISILNSFLSILSILSNKRKMELRRFHLLYSFQSLTLPISVGIQTVYPLHRSFVFCFQVDYIQYSDEIANLIGCKPTLWKLLFTDPVLAFHCFAGPCTPPQYRLTGPGIWSGARDAIMNAYYKTTYSTRSRKVEKVKSSNLEFPFVFMLIFFLMIVVAMLIKVKL